MPDPLAQFEAAWRKPIHPLHRTLADPLRAEPAATTGTPVRPWTMGDRTGEGLGHLGVTAVQVSGAAGPR